MQVSLATPEKIVFSGQADDVLIQAEKGQINILDRHSNLITLVKKGPVVVKAAQGNLNFTVGEGVLKVEDNKVSILCGEISRG
jgi:F-type H+-transporting ATPase subunit epsilon